MYACCIFCPTAQFAGPMVGAHGHDEAHARHPPGRHRCPAERRRAEEQALVARREAALAGLPAALRARHVVVNAGAHSLLMAQQLGFGLEYSCLPVAGSFYFVQGGGTGILVWFGLHVLQKLRWPIRNPCSTITAN